MMDRDSQGHASYNVLVSFEKLRIYSFVTGNYFFFLTITASRRFGKTFAGIVF